jgi:ubiquinone/menaquinone biosynthesis C-methylase UbiE
MESIEETITKVVYGTTFAQYNREEFLKFLRPLEVRLHANGISQDVFKDKHCLDAGCGGGRGTVLMARAGAKEVVSFDLSEQNIGTTLRNATLFDLHNVKAQQGSLLELPFPDESFDVVWCNGVVHHTTNPDRALCEITRVLKIGGKLWLYLYGSGGIYWFMVDFFREWLADIELETTRLTLSLFQTPTGCIAEFIDDWYVPNLKRYAREDVENRLEELGFPEPKYLKEGMTYDTSARRGDPQENAWMGVGDLRYWATKNSRATGQSENPLPNVNNIGSVYTDTPEVETFAKDFNELRQAAEDFGRQHPALKKVARVAAASRLQTVLRCTLSRQAPFDSQEFREQIRAQISFFRPPG